MKRWLSEITVGEAFLLVLALAIGTVVVALIISLLVGFVLATIQSLF